MMRYVLSCLLLGILAWGQATKPTSSPPALAASSQPADATNADGSSAPDSRIGPDVAVITVNGLCEASHAGSDSKDCVTVITRAQFEKLVADIQPDMSLPSQRQFAARYAETLILAQKAHEMGIDQGQEFDEHMEIARVSILSEALSDALHEKAQISEKEIEDYYHRHLADYEEANVQRMFVPRIQQLPTLKEKLTEEQQRARKQESENAMKAEAEKLRARAVAGENFNTLQDEAFELAGIHAGPSNASLGEMRRSQMPANQAFVMDLKPGEVSSIITDPSGYIVYRVDSKTTEPLSQVHSDIRDVLVGQRVQEQLKSLLEAANPVLDERYFGSEKP